MEKTSNNKALIAHLSMFGACAGWGLMAPIGKDAMTHGFDGMSMVTFRVVGACVLFWIASLFAPKEHVPRKDKLMFIGAAIFGLLCNQCCYTANGKFITYSLPVSSKDTSGNWVKSYMACRFKKGVSLANKTKIKINNAFFTTSKSGDKVYTNLMITDFDVLEEGETAGNEADNFVPIPEPQDDPFL